ncbi:MAG TPA: hypothetical protein VKZ79_16740 [Alphaproteobacteria bacterium]|nr:hypothetical protein [Alphaproteobacteria bacterium]
MKLIFAVATATLVAGVASAADLSGTWAVKGDIAGNAVEPTCTFKQAGGALTGKCGTGDNSGDISNGTVSGTNVAWTWSAGGYSLDFKGTADSDKSMKGSIDVGGGSGTFTATKQ